MAEAFTYCWTDHKTNKLYVGWHKGSPDDGYVCSGKYMLEEYEKRPQDFTRQIIATGDSYSMKVLERNILMSAKAAQSDDFYNKSNSTGMFYFDDIIRKKMAEAKKGVKRSKASCIKQSKSVSGSNNHFYGKTHTEEARDIMSKKAKVRSAGARNNKAKKVVYNGETFGCKKFLTEKYGMSLYMINKMIGTGEITYGN